MTARISCPDTAALMASDSLYAVFDIRERGEFNTRQIANATSLPRSQIEFRIDKLVPNRKVPIVVYDDDGERAELAASTLAELGYSNVSVLEGGLPAWQQARLPTVSGVNVPSKAFGERVHHEQGIPDISPEELRNLQNKAADLMILDMRTPEEFGRFCIPGAINVPGGDVVLWVDALKRKPEGSIIVNCAGRTRSIIGTAGLGRLGLKNVRALKNGTMGWVLAGFELESHPVRPATGAATRSRERATALALQLAAEDGIPFISAQEIMRILGRHSSDQSVQQESKESPSCVSPASGESGRGGNDSSKDSSIRDLNGGVTYLIDVRSENEYLSGHLPRSLNIPGGQAVQRADDFIAVRNAKIIFVSNTSARAVMAAYWYRQMGLKNIAALRGGLRAWIESGESLAQGADQTEPLGYETAAQSVRFIDARALAEEIKNPGALIVDVGASLDFESGHIPDAYWLSRGWIEIKLPERFPERNRRIVLTCSDGRNSVLAAQALKAIGYTDVAVLRGGVKGWTNRGLGIETGIERCLAEVNDVVVSPSIRGNKEEMRRYLDWEVKLAGK